MWPLTLKQNYGGARIEHLRCVKEEFALLASRSGACGKLVYKLRILSI